MRPLLALLLAATASGCVHATTFPDQSPGPTFGGRAGVSRLADKVGEARGTCREARTALRKEARDLERRHNLYATLGATFGASGGAAALGSTADSGRGVKNTLTIGGALLAVAGAVATGVSSKDSDLLAKLQERALKIKSLESEVDTLVATRKEDEDGSGKAPTDELLVKKLDELSEACAEP